ncbi:MAG TPA: hypothetical protein VIN61_00865 [Gammaproteobacteria bacterium]
MPAGALGGSRRSVSRPGGRFARGLAALAAAAAAATWAAGPAAAQGTGAGRPDFSGLWFPAGGARTTPNPLPFTPAAQKLREQYQREFTLDDDPGRYCIWPGMPRAVWGAPFTIEIFHRDHDLTIFWEGYGMYRKIYMADHAPPKPFVPTAMGYSVAHWEGDTLVIETTNLKPYPYMTRLATTSDAHVLERMHLEERRGEDGQTRKYLVDEITLTDPKMYTEPVRIRAEAVARPDLQLLEYTCTDTLWDEYLQERGLTVPDVDALPEPGED